MAEVIDLTTYDSFNLFLHALRTEVVQNLPAAGTVVSGGCAGEWYFDWFAENYKGTPDRHYGIELFSSRPATLPDNVVWLQQSLGDMAGVADGEADLVFAGEVIEHLWPDDIAGFLLEARRVLAPNGTLALDSPNRSMAQALRWTQPEHTLEFSPSEILEVLGLAGFDVPALRGVWLCYDRESRRLLPREELDGQILTRRQRIDLAAERPEDSFVWWLHATPGANPPDEAALRRRLIDLYSAYRPERERRLLSRRPLLWDRQLGRVVAHDGEQRETLFYGPYIPVPEGRWEAAFQVRARGLPADLAPPTRVARAEVVSEGHVVARKAISAGMLARTGSVVEVVVPFGFDTTRMAVEFRLVASGTAPFDAVMEVDLRRRAQRPKSKGKTTAERAKRTPPASSPVPRTAAQRVLQGAGSVVKAIDRPTNGAATRGLRSARRRARSIRSSAAARTGRSDSSGGPPGPSRGPAKSSELALLAALSKACDLADFRAGPTRTAIREVFAHEVDVHDADWPTGAEYRKHWEVAMAVRAFRELGVLRPDAEVLGVGAGNEPTLYWLTNQVGRVVATDLYLGDDWQESANSAMFSDPGRYWPGPWDAARLEVRHMDGRELAFPDDSFDGVFSSSSIEHFGDLTDIGRTVDEMYRVLRPGGVLSLSTEVRLAGKGPGLPGILLFTRRQLREAIVQRRPWIGVPPTVEVSAETRAAAQAFGPAASEVTAHVAEHGALYLHRLRWSTYPHVVLEHEGYVWTSVHMALRKPVS